MLALLFCAKFCDPVLFSATFSRTLFFLRLFILLFRDVLEEFLIKIFTGGLELADRLLNKLGFVNNVEWGSDLWPESKLVWRLKEVDEAEHRFHKG